jgi:hypothetical protein
MAVVTTHKVSFGVIHCLFFHPKASGDCHFGQRCSLQILAVTNLAVVLIVFVKILMTIIVPTRIIDVM